MEDFTAELARRLAAAYISTCLGTSFVTEYKKLVGDPGTYWRELARAVTSSPPAITGPSRGLGEGQT